eukprot:14145787-Ditylum_brightwellii.AAC.1
MRCNDSSNDVTSDILPQLCLIQDALVTMFSFLNRTALPHALPSLSEVNGHDEDLENNYLDYNDSFPNANIMDAVPSLSIGVGVPQCN